MQQPSWERIQEIYHSALVLPPSERDAFVEKACVGDPVLVREVKSLLHAHNSTGDFLNTPVFKLDFVPEDFVGTTIGERYVIERELPHGGMSHVYFARDLRINHRAVVIKILSQTLVEHPDARRRFEQELATLSYIQHEGVVRVSDKGELADGRPYIVMEYVDGEMLRLQIPNEGMDLARAASILKQLGEALDHAHEKGIFHRDLKPENIIVKRGTDSIVLIDFGIAKVQDSVAQTTAHGITPGTLPYMSPEQLRGDNITAASDIYSMAVIAYELVTGRRPFNPNSASQLAPMQRAGVRVKPIDLRPNLPARAQDVILRGLSFNPKARYGNAKEFGDELARNLQEFAPSNGHSWGKVIAACLMILGAVIISVYMILNGTNKPEPTRSFDYWLTVQEMENGQPSNSFRSHGENDVFANGDKFQLTVVTPVPAYFYIFYESPPAPNENSFKMIYPNQKTNKGLASLGANQPLQLDWMTFMGPEGTENFWLVWSTSPVGELDAVSSEAFKQPDGGFTGQTQVTVKQYLMAKKAEIDATTYNYNSNRTAVVRGKHDMLVTLAQFKHR
jgi:serine/threonine protein kinase